MEKFIDPIFLAKAHREVDAWFPPHPKVNEALLTRLHPKWEDEFDGQTGLQKVDAF